MSGQVEKVTWDGGGCVYVSVEESEVPLEIRYWGVPRPVSIWRQKTMEFGSDKVEPIPPGATYMRVVDRSNCSDAAGYVTYFRRQTERTEGVWL